MDTLQFLSYRVAFTELPFGELQVALRQVQCGEPWRESFRRIARNLRRLAEDAEVSCRYVSAVRAWRWTACAYHATSFGLHLDPERHGHPREIVKWRRLARIAYLRAVHLDPSVACPVAIPFGTTTIYGYLRAPSRGAAPVVVLLNGLDSVCEVELHTFGSWLRERGLAVLSLDLPASLASRPRTPMFAVEEVAPAVADWVTQHPRLVHGSLGAFGVSFGGHLVARLLAGDPRFRAGVAVSPAAWIGLRELHLKRVRCMLACTFDLYKEADIDALTSRIRIEQLPPPEGQFLIFQMEQDQLFGLEHEYAFRAWGKDAVEVRRVCAEHVGTSQFHRWLPEACDWLAEHLFCKKGV